ncbi:MAG TPA: phenylalanine--tRNA ligase subunit alpha [Candidatus Acidoferrum sp.]|nr:phenylalanine--tRNA ligase subunit alpha [Candidatus Acidoferrum sp.]
MLNALARECAPYGVIYFATMPTEDNPTAKTLRELGVNDAQGVAEKFADLRARFDAQAHESMNGQSWEMLRQFWVGRKAGILTAITENWLKPSETELKRVVGQELNKFKAHLEKTLEERRIAMESGAEEAALARERIDLSLPGVIHPIGSHHLIRQVFEQIEDIFFSIGFSVVEGPEIETPYYNFEALNIPEFHPVRDDMDTFYLDLPKGAPAPLLLRTHTSPMQIRTMEKHKPPVRVIVPGKVYRRDNPDATHSFMFHQVEGLAVDTDITFCDFTGTIEYFVKQFFGEAVKTRFRPSYFPFTEPSVEFDVSCIFCGGSGSAAGGGTCSKCKGSGWIELFGAGMVDPAVYGFVNYDAKKVSGFAWGMGIDRLAMLKYGIDDIQVFFQSDVRFLGQFP